MSFMVSLFYLALRTTESKQQCLIDAETQNLNRNITCHQFSFRDYYCFIYIFSIKNLAPLFYLLFFFKHLWHLKIMN